MVDDDARCRCGATAWTRVAVACRGEDELEVEPQACAIAPARRVCVACGAAEPAVVAATSMATIAPTADAGLAWAALAGAAAALATVIVLA